MAGENDVRSGGATTDAGEEGRAVVEEKIERKFAKTPARSMDQREREMPGEDHVSTAQIRATEDVRNMEMEDLVPVVSVAPYNGWEIRVWRVGPSSWKGEEVEQRQIMRLTNGMSWGELEKRIEDVHGGGTYDVTIRDQKGVTRKKRKMDISGEPTWTPKDYPEFFSDPEDMSDEERELQKKIRLKKLKQQEKELDEEMRGGQPAGFPDLSGVTAMFSPLLQTMQMQAEAAERRQAEMERRMEERDRRSEERMAQMMEMFSESLASRDDEAAGSKSMELLIAQMNNSTQLMMANMQADREAAERRAEADRCASEERAKTERDNMQMFMTILKDAKGQDNTIPLLQLISENQMHKSDMNWSMTKTILELFADRGDVDKDPTVQMIEAVMGGVKDAADLVRFGTQLQDIKGGRQAPALSQAGQPRPQGPPPVPQAGHAQPGPAPGPANPPAGPGPMPDPSQTPNPMQNIVTAYERLDDLRKMNFIVTTMLNEAKTMPEPEQSIFCNLTLHPATPDSLLEFIDDVKDARDMRQQFVEMQMPPATLTKADNIIFRDLNRVDWLDRCLDFIKSNLLPLDDDGEVPAGSEPIAQPGPTEAPAEGQGVGSGATPPAPEPETPDGEADKEPETEKPPKKEPAKKKAAKKSTGKKPRKNK